MHAGPCRPVLFSVLIFAMLLYVTVTLRINYDTGVFGRVKIDLIGSVLITYIIIITGIS
jgi:hypothetical protein